MSMRMELEDLPPRFRAQAEAQIAARCREKCASPQPVADAARAAGKLGKVAEAEAEEKSRGRNRIYNFVPHDV